MSDQPPTDQPPTDQPPTSGEEREPTGSAAASAPPRGGFTLRGRTWVYGATLAAAGVLAGGGVTYAVVSASPGVQAQPFSAADGGGRSGSNSGLNGGPPGGSSDGRPGALPDGQAPEGSQPSAGPSTSGEST